MRNFSNKIERVLFSKYFDYTLLACGMFFMIPLGIKGLVKALGKNDLTLIIVFLFVLALWTYGSVRIVLSLIKGKNSFPIK